VRSGNCETQAGFGQESIEIKGHRDAVSGMPGRSSCG
jgi:hypothetical protein